MKNALRISLRLLLVLLLVLVAGRAQAGTISGTVRAEGKAGADSAAGGGQYETRKFKFAERVNYDALQDFVVHLEGSINVSNAIAPRTLVVDTRRNVTQKGARFTPHVLPVPVGTTVEWPNHDEIFHNVFSVSDAKPFDLGLYKHPEVKRVVFDRPGRVDALCSIHSAMHCIILVLENPYFATVDPQGRYRMTEVPAGTYRIRAWHERLPPQVKEITVPDSGTVQADFVLGITNLPKY